MRHKIIMFILFFFSVLSFSQTQVQKEDAKWILERITGVKWAADDPVILQMTALIQKGNRRGAAELATKQSQFLNQTVKNFALKMSTREETIRLPLNDFSATVIGVVRDEVDARQLLYGNFLYVGDPSKLTRTGDAGTDEKLFAPTSLNNYANHILRSNNHYAALDNKKIDIGQILLRRSTQYLIKSENDGNFVLAKNPDPAGILTSRTFVEAHATAGTNRRPVEFAFREFMCLPIQEWADTSSSDIRIGRDIDRRPGGDHLKFQTSCKGCHTVMDGFRGAWAKWDFENGSSVQSVVRRGRSDGNGVMDKLNRNATVYPGGYITIGDSWVNNADRGINQSLMGWRGLDGRSPASTGNGVNTFGRMIANSKRFSTCMGKRVFEQVCNKELPASEISTYEALGTKLEIFNYSLKQLFVEAALHPKCK